MENKLRTSKDSFYKKVSSSKGFTHQSKAEIYPTLIQMLRSDLLMIQDMIQANSSDMKMYKILSKNPNLVRKLTDIEENQDIKPMIDKVGEVSQSIERIGKTYNCTNANDLIKKIYLELGYNELLNKKLCDLFILMKLKLCNDETFQDSLSKVIPLKTFIEKIIQKIKTNSNEVNSTQENKPTILTGIDSAKTTQQMKEYDELLKIGTLNELIKSDLSKNKLCQHFYKLLCNYFQNINMTFKKIILKHKENINEVEGSELDKFFKLKDNIEKIIKDLSDENNSLKTYSKDDSLDKEINKLKADIASLNELKEQNQIEIADLHKTIESLKASSITKDNSLKYTEEQYNQMKVSLQTELEKIKQSSSNKEKELHKEIDTLNSTIRDLEEKLKSSTNSRASPAGPIEQVNFEEIIKKHDKEFKKLKEETSLKLDREIKDLQKSNSKLKETNNNLKLENESLKKQANILNSKNFNPDSYEQVLLEQFETMKSAFVKKIDDITLELSQTKSDSRSKIYSLEQELKESKHLKDVFLQQIIQLQKQLNI